MYSYYTMSPRTARSQPAVKKPTGERYSAADVWAAACAAHRVNGAYIKSPGPSGLGQSLEPNRELMAKFLAAPEEMFEHDHVMGANCRKWLQGDLLVRALKNKATDFDKAVMQVCELEEFDTGYNSYQLAVIPCLPNSWQRGLAREQVQERVRAATGDYLGNVGTKVTSNIEVLKTNYSAQYNTYYVTAIDDENRSMFFSYREQLPPGTFGKVSGTVKAHRDGNTQLTRVKFIKTGETRVKFTAEVA